jgi:hypothetical protein
MTLPPILADILRLLSQLPPEALTPILELVKALRSSNDPTALARRAAAIASEAASDAAIRKALDP